MNRLYRRTMIESTAILLLFVMSISQAPEVGEYAISIDVARISVPSGIVWSDNFDDEDISDWQLFKVNHSATPDILMPGNSTAVGGVLRHLETEWSYAGHNSSVAFGTWTFDVDIQEPVDEWHFYVVFISEQFDDDWLTYAQIGSAYAIGFYIRGYYDDEICILRGAHDLGPLWMDHYYDDDITGWKNIIITRELSGQFYVYLDGSLILKGKNMHHTTSERFYFVSHGGPAIDNVTVSDTIDYDKAPPEWSEPILDQEISLGESFYYDINATDYSEIDQYWIDDTQNFTIDEQGVITSIGDLVMGTYDITVSVNDTLGNTRTETFTLTVLGVTTTTTTTTTTITTTPPETTTATTTSTTPTDGEIDMTMILLVGGGVAAIVVIVLIVWKVKGRT